MLLLDGGDVEEGSVRLSGLSKGVAGWRLLGAAGSARSRMLTVGAFRVGVIGATDYYPQYDEAPRRLGGRDAELPTERRAGHGSRVPGITPDRAFIDNGGPCLWTSDYWFHVDGSDVHADSCRLVVTPSGSVQLRATYPADPLSCG